VNKKTSKKATNRRNARKPKTTTKARATKPVTTKRTTALSDEHKAKISAALKGLTPWNKNKKTGIKPWNFGKSSKSAAE